MPRKGSKQPYKPKKEYRYTVKDIAELAGMTRTALHVAKVRGKIDPGDFKSVVSFLARRLSTNVSAETSLLLQRVAQKK